MYKNVDGVKAEMTKSEEKEYLQRVEENKKLPPPAPTPEQEIAELKAQIAAMQSAYERGVNA